MKAVVRFLLAILLVIVAAVVVVGPGRLVAGAEYPVGLGPLSSTGRYCHHMYSLTHLVDVWHDSGAPATPEQKTTYLALKKTLSTSGPEVPQADFTIFFRTRGEVLKNMTATTAALNKWWDQNCTELFMEAPASLNRTWSGMLGQENFTHYPKNVVKLANFFRVMAG
jgi:hypothetical protein